MIFLYSVATHRLLRIMGEGTGTPTLQREIPLKNDPNFFHFFLKTKNGKEGWTLLGPLEASRGPWIT